MNNNDYCRLTLSEQLGHVICEHSVKDSAYSSQLLSLAHDVYSDVSAHVEAMMCLVRQGRIEGVVQYAKDYSRQHIIDVLINISQLLS